MGTGSSPYPAASVDEPGLAAQDVIANVAFDIFADHNPDNAHYEVKAETEIMIWLGTFGKPYPLGWDDTSCCGSTTIGGVELQVSAQPQDLTCKLANTLLVIYIEGRTKGGLWSSPGLPNRTRWPSMKTYHR